VKIVDLPTFLSLPAGTIYAKYEPCIFGDLHIKDESVAAGEVGTWWYQDLIPWFTTSTDSLSYLDALDKVQAGEPSPQLDYSSTSKDGLYEKDQLFAVFERRDVEALIERMQSALNDGYTAAGEG
jgi:hypothetical protein